MNDLEVAQTAIATLADKLNAATARADEMAITRQKLGFLVYTANDVTARRELNALNTEMATLAEETQDLKAALVQAHAKLDAAKAAAMRTDANEHRVRARAILGELTALGPELDRAIPHPDDGVPYAFSDPPTVCKTAALAHALVVECRALGLGRDATFPKSWHGAAGKIDLEKALRNTVCAGWPSLSGEIRPATRTSIMFGVRQTVDFTRLLGVWAKAVRADLDRHEQTNKAEIAA
jgi:hypothetical protein